MPSATIIALSVLVALLGSGLIATTTLILVKKPTCPTCPNNCYAESVSDWKAGN